MSKFELTWKNFQKEENEKEIIAEGLVVIFFFYFFLSFVSFWQFLEGDVPYSSFWHAPWKWILNAIL
ncbi:MAG: hypothetical protein AAB405_02150 [Patescibacteria group bacterium]